MTSARKTALAATAALMIAVAGCRPRLETDTCSPANPVRTVAPDPSVPMRFFFGNLHKDDPTHPEQIAVSAPIWFFRAGSAARASPP